MHGFVRELLQRGDVIHDPDAASVCPDDQVVLARLHEQIIDPDGRQAGGEPFPLAPGVHRDEKPEFGSNEQQVRIAGVFLDDVDVARCREVAGD